MNTPSDSLLMATTANLMVLSRAYRGAADKALADYGLSQATAWPVILAGRLGDGVRQGALAGRWAWKALPWCACWTSWSPPA